MFAKHHQQHIRPQFICVPANDQNRQVIEVLYKYDIIHPHRIMPPDDPSLIVSSYREWNSIFTNGSTSVHYFPDTFSIDKLNDLVWDLARKDGILLHTLIQCIDRGDRHYASVEKYLNRIKDDPLLWRSIWTSPSLVGEEKKQCKITAFLAPKSTTKEEEENDLVIEVHNLLSD